MKIEEFIESIMTTSLSNANLNEQAIFPAEKDRFRCRTLDTQELEFTTDTDFKTKLQESLLLWEQDGTRAVWVKVAILHSSLVPVLTALDFHFHHAQRDYVMMKKWIAKHEPDNTPDYAGQYLGCAGFVVNSQGQVLVVQEKYHTKKHWKLPGGHADPGEEISEAARREVFEETGIQSEFQSVICFRHQHNYKYGCSDFYFVCLMTAINENISKGDNEISACKWMEVQDLIDHPDTAQLNRHIAQCYQKLVRSGQFTLTSTPVPSFNHKVQELVYSVQPCRIEEGRTIFVQPCRIEEGRTVFISRGAEEEVSSRLNMSDSSNTSTTTSDKQVSGSCNGELSHFSKLPNQEHSHLKLTNQEVVSSLKVTNHEQLSSSDCTQQEAPLVS